VNIKFQDKTAKFKLRSGSSSSDIKEALRNRFEISNDSPLTLIDSDGFVAVIDHTLQGGNYEIHTNISQLPTSLREYTLYKYEHCPFCCRVVLLLGWKKIPHQTIIFGYGDSEGPTKLVGKKVAPILGYKDEGKERYMGESLDIVKFLDESEKPLLLKSETKRTDLKEWAERLSESAGNLQKPRVRQVFKKDFSKQEDLDYFAKKYQINFDELKAKSGDYIKVVDGSLRDFESLIKGDKTLNEGGLGYDDVIYLPTLRNLTYVKGITWPAKVKEYVLTNCENGGLTTYFDQQI